jgi:hypothetical protein
VWKCLYSITIHFSSLAFCPEIPWNKESTLQHFIHSLHITSIHNANCAFPRSGIVSSIMMKGLTVDQFYEMTDSIVGDKAIQCIWKLECNICHRRCESITCNLAASYKTISQIIVLCRRVIATDNTANYLTAFLSTLQLFTVWPTFINQILQCTCTILMVLLNTWDLKLLIQLESKGFWRWWITLGITGFLDFAHHPVF